MKFPKFVFVGDVGLRESKESKLAKSPEDWDGWPAWAKIQNTKNVIPWKIIQKDFYDKGTQHGLDWDVEQLPRPFRTQTSACRFESFNLAQFTLN